MLNEKINQDEQITCPSVGYQTMSVCVPVSVTPFASVGTTVTRCCGDPVVTANGNCGGRKNGSCTFTITQVICIEVPVEFGAVAAAGDTFTECLGASGDGCEDCDEDNQPA